MQYLRLNFVKDLKRSTTAIHLFCSQTAFKVATPRTVERPKAGPNKNLLSTIRDSEGIVPLGARDHSRWRPAIFRGLQHPEEQRAAGCPSCGSAVERTANFCSQCGTPLVWRCVGCNFRNTWNAVRCVECGCAPEGGQHRCESEPGGQLLEPQPGFAVERRQLTILMADIVGSTELAVRAGPEEYRETLAAYHLCVEQCVRAAGGEVAQFLGDDVLASFGQRQTGGNHAERAIRAALQLVRDVNRLEVGRQQIRARVGVATGLVVVSDVLRSADMVGHAIAGITPNMATRLQELADPEAVVIADSTKQLAGRFFVYRSLGPHQLKGFAEPVEAWQVEAEGAVESRFSALRRSSTTELIGRAAEMAQLAGMWRSAQTGKGQVLLLRGNAGIGKSHLIDAFCHTAVNGLRSHVLDLHASPHHANTALYAVTKLLQREARLVSGDSVDM
jgi:class 3 adenylate cyclase/predicted RNA-binding Zn-ribbon protein involved in translation (DUF1610 family)